VLSGAREAVSWRCERNRGCTMSKRQSHPASSLNDDALEALNGQHTDWGARPKGGGMQAVVSLLRSEAPIDHEVRLLLAELLDPKGHSTWQLVAKRRRAGQLSKGDIGRRLEIGRQIAAGISMPGDFEATIAVAMADHRIGRSYAAECYRLWRAVVQRMAEETNESA
jgi:hypothetical protein